MAFADFPRQRQAIQLLQRSLQKGRLAHAYLFCGEDLAELEGMARTLAKVLNCITGADDRGAAAAVDSCDACDSCRRINGDNHPDITWLRPESKSRVITVEQIRRLLQIVHLKPVVARHKVAVIVAADRLNVQAGNAFLKTLEEPPSRSILILLSSEPQRILETIQSRCLRLSFEGTVLPKLDEESAGCLATFADQVGAESRSLLGRYRALDAVLKRLTAVRGEVEQRLNRESPIERYEDVEPALRERWEDELSAAVEAEYRRRRGDLLTAFEWWLRDIWLGTLEADPRLSAFPQLAEATRQVARRISPGEASENLRKLERLQRLLGSNVQESLALEVGLLGLRL